MYRFLWYSTLVTREALDAVNGCDDLFSEDAPLLIEGGCAVGISFHVGCCLRIIITQNVKPNNEDRIFINSRICGELWSSTDSTSYELSDTSFIRVVSKRQVWIISHCKRSCSGVSINEVLEKLCVLCNDVHLSDMQIWWACWFQVFWLVWKESLECLCGVLWFFSSRFVGLFVMTQI